MRLSIYLLLFFIISARLAHGQGANTNKLDKGLIQFFVGSWNGAGQFASGKPIEATAKFDVSLDSCWITYTHNDKLPNQYKAISMWGIDQKSGGFMAYVFDNFGGHRQFTGTIWDKHLLSFTNTGLQPSGKKVFQRFSYEVLDKDKFKMTYDVSADSLSWHEGDHLIFNRVK